MKPFEVGHPGMLFSGESELPVRGKRAGFLSPAVGYATGSEVMRMGTATALVPLSEYLATSYEHDCEWVDGELRERGVPDEFHSAIQAFFLQYFYRLRLELGVRVRPELRVRVAERRYRIPDVTLLPASAPVQEIPDAPPLLCIEVLSPDDSWGEMQEKIGDYLLMGVGAVWIVDPRRRLMYAADARGTHAVEVLELAGTHVAIRPEEVFAELDGLKEPVE